MLSPDPDLIMLSSKRDPVRQVPGKGWLALAIFLLTVWAAAVIRFSVGEVMLAGTLVMVITNILTMEQVYRAIEWKVVFPVAGMLPLGVAMTSTGATELFATALTDLTRPLGPPALLLARGLHRAAVTGDEGGCGVGGHGPDRHAGRAATGGRSAGDGDGYRAGDLDGLRHAPRPPGQHPDDGPRGVPQARLPASGPAADPPADRGRPGDAAGPLAPDASLETGGTALPAHAPSGAVRIAPAPLLTRPDRRAGGWSPAEDSTRLPGERIYETKDAVGWPVARVPREGGGKRRVVPCPSRSNVRQTRHVHGSRRIRA